MRPSDERPADLILTDARAETCFVEFAHDLVE
jgi:hypothetical protein